MNLPLWNEVIILSIQTVLDDHSPTPSKHKTAIKKLKQHAISDVVKSKSGKLLFCQRHQS